MSSIRVTTWAALLACLAVPAAAQQAALPLKRPAQPTKPEISAEDLMSRLYVFSDDSMQGRQTGTDGHRKGTDYIAAEAQRKFGGDSVAEFVRNARSFAESLRK
mgnify:CR=1 FL=1